MQVSLKRVSTRSCNSVHEVLDEIHWQRRAFVRNCSQRARRMWGRRKRWWWSPGDARDGIGYDRSAVRFCGAN